MQLDQRTLERLAARLPGYDLGELRILDTAAQILPDEWMDAEAEAVAARVASETRVAGPPLINKDGRPTILKMVMWMCHADCVNLNGDAFVMEELKAMTAGLFREPNFGVMDWNHSAIFSWNDDPKCMGVWYKADYAWDKAANGGTGAWGILVTGMMFAWLFPEQTDSLVAEQQRSGSIKGSMACIPKSVEFGEVGGKRCSILHNPTFFTHSLLDVPPADPDAVGATTEDPDTGPDDLLKLCVDGLPDASGSETSTDTTAEAAYKLSEADTADGPILGLLVRCKTEAGRQVAARVRTALAQIHQEDVMTPEEITALEKAKADLERRVAELESELAEAKKKAPPKDKDKEDDMPPPYKKKAEDLEAEMTTLKQTIAELTTSRDALAAELATANETVTAHAAKIAELQAAVDAEASAKAEVARVERLATRLASLPESFRKAHAKRDDAVRAELEAKWAALTDEQWESHKTHELLFGFSASSKAGYVDRSLKEGVLPQSDTSVEDIRSKLRSSLKSQR